MKPDSTSHRATIITAMSWAFVAACGAMTFASEPTSVVFNRDVRPILSENCFHCHGPDANKREADLRLDTASGATADLGGYAAIKPKDLSASELWARVNSDDPDERMPPADTGKELSPVQLDILQRWIESGAEYQQHWSYLPLQRPTVPIGIPNASPGPAPSAPAPASDQTKPSKTQGLVTWPTNAIDTFIRRSQATAGVTPAPRADRVTLMRRVSFDLTGAPPTRSEIEAFLADARPGAYERWVDHLLASPRFGERLAVYWLDLVRYADTVGYHGDQDHNAVMYREYVIRALNAGTPFDRFTVEQLAGDLLPQPTDSQLAASGYNRLLQTTHEGGAQDKEYLAKYAADRVRNVSTVWMGATLGCAECHDHKFDPYTQKDFYSMAAFFADLTEQGAYSAPNSLPTTRAPEKPLLSEPDRLALESIDHELAALPEQKDDSDDIKQRRQALQKAREAIAARAVLQMVSQPREPRTMRILNRGDWMDNSGEIVQPATPAFLPSLRPQTEPQDNPPRATRLDLARWLVSKEQPQTARVLVNRLWALLFGEGISRGVEDTGSQGQWPTHPELLEYLASELVDNGWELKPLLRQIVTSSVYCQSSIPTSKTLAADPENIHWTRQNRFRLSAEMVRDQALLVSGLLVERIGGESARPYQPAGYYSHLNFPQRRYTADSGAGQYRRGVYIHWQRQFLHPMLLAFDAPSREECTSARARSNTPQAALALLNDPTFVEAARRLAARIVPEDAADEGRSDSAILANLWQQVVSRPPTSAEENLCLQLLASRRQRYADDPQAAEQLLSVGMSARGSETEPVELAAWTCVARALLSLSETLTRN